MNQTILVSGGTGYIGSWVSKKLLEKGYTVRLAVRNKQKKEKYQHLLKLADQHKGSLELWEANLLDEGSYDEAAHDSDAIIHMASPFTLRFKDAQKDLIEPAVLGTKNILGAANRSKAVKKIVLTSSVAAVHGDAIDMKVKGLEEFTEAHFNESSSPTHQPYSYSKVTAEKEAWKIHDAQSKWKLVVINPSFVMGPSLTKNSDSESISFIKDMLSGKFSAGAPSLMFGFVDVRDVADAHILALENEKAEGRHILAERADRVIQLAHIIRDEFGKKYKLPKKESPKLLMYLVGWMFGLSWKFINRNIGHTIRFNTTKSKEKLGMNYRPLKETVVDMVKQMEEDNSI